VNRSKFTAQEARSDRRREFKPYKVGMQVSCGVDTEVSEEELVWGVAKVSGINIPRTRHAKRESGD